MPDPKVITLSTYLRNEGQTACYDLKGRQDGHGLGRKGLFKVLFVRGALRRPLDDVDGLGVTRHFEFAKVTSTKVLITKKNSE